MTGQVGESQIALVTGIGRPEGIGFEVCRQLGAQGMTVLLTARDQDKVEAVAQSLRSAGLDVYPYALDVTQDTSVCASSPDRTGVGVIGCAE